MRWTERIQFTRDELCHWIGMGDFELISPDGQHLVQIIYKGEPPRGDSYHSAIIDGHILPGHVWGGKISFSPCSCYLCFSYMPEKWERTTAVVNLQAHRYSLLPEYMNAVQISWPRITETGATGDEKSYAFTGHEHWFHF